MKRKWVSRIHLLETICVTFRLYCLVFFLFPSQCAFWLWMQHGTSTHVQHRCLNISVSSSSCSSSSSGMASLKCLDLPSYTWRIPMYVRCVCGGDWDELGKKNKRKKRKKNRRGGGGCYRHVTAMYDAAWSDGFQKILFDVNIIHVR